MFTGIVEELGSVASREGQRLRIAADVVTSDAGIGDSISVNGVCLTVTELDGQGFTADLMGETVQRTALGGLEPGAPVNLERALRADARLGGHLVQGHVDGVAEVLAVTPHEEWTTVRFGLPKDLLPYVAEKGSIAVDGVSLTVTAVDDGGWFEVGLIPHTLAVTVLGRRAAGERVNLEVDVLARYVERMLSKER